MIHANDLNNALIEVLQRPKTYSDRRIILRHCNKKNLLAIAVSAALFSTTGTANAALVSACSGVSLPPSVVTNIVGQAVLPLTTSLNGVLSLLLGPLNLNTNLTTTLASIASGAPIDLNVLDTSGNVVAAGAPCQTTSDSYTLDTAQGISIGGNQITGLGSGTVAAAGELNSIAFGNGATTNAAASDSVAIGPNATVGALGVNSMALGSGASVNVANSIALGAGSTATVGAETNYTAYGLSAPQTSVGEISVGSTGNTRKITNVAAGSAATDAVNVAQLQAVNDGAVKYDPLSLKMTVTLGSTLSTDGGITNGTTIANLHQGQLNATSTDAVNGAQLYATNQSILSISNGASNKYFRANSAAVDATATGAESVAIGPRAVSSGTSSVAIGDNANASQTGSIAIGAASQATRAGMNGTTEKYSNVAIASTQGAVSVGSLGNERQITNVAGGTAATDAVNVRQLDAALNQTNQDFYNQINGLQSEIGIVKYDANAGTAAAMAMASMPQSVIAGKAMMTAGIANYQGQSAVAFGISNFSDNGRWILNVNGTANSRGKAGAGVGVGFHW